MTREDQPSHAESVPDEGRVRRQQGISTALYTQAERRRRDESVWTLVQGVLAPLQFLVFLISLGLVIRTLATGEGAFAADLSDANGRCCSTAATVYSNFSV